MSNSVLRQLLSPFGIFPGKVTKAFELRSLIDALKINSTMQELVRIGPEHDGGYLVPDDLSGINYCFSPGVAECSLFEMQLADMGMKIFLADRSVEKPTTDHTNFCFEKKFIASTNCLNEDLMTLDRWYSDMLSVPDDNSPEAILQMDIEGSEYEVMHSVSDKLLRRFRIIIIEFHKLNQLADRFSFKLMAPVFYKILKTHAVVHIHPNNNRRTLSIHGVKIPANMEFTFLRRDRLQRAFKPLHFPNPLDHRCNNSNAELELPECWYK